MNSYETRKTLERELKKHQNGCKKITAISKKVISCLSFADKAILRDDILKFFIENYKELNQNELKAVLKTLYRVGVRKIDKIKLLSDGNYRFIQAV